MAADGKPSEATAAAVPGPGLLCAAAAALLSPLLLAALFPLLPPLARSYALKLPLPALEIQCALAFALFLLPLFRAPAPGEANPVLVGLVRGAFLGAVALPFVLAARIVWPVPVGRILAGCLLVAGAGAGAAGATAAFRARGMATAVALAGLPPLLGFLARDVYPRLAWLANKSVSL